MDFQVPEFLKNCPKYDAIKGLTFATDVKHLKGGRLERPDHIPIDIFLNEIPFYRRDINSNIVNKITRILLNCWNFLYHEKYGMIT